MKKLVFALAACMAISTFAPAQAMPLGAFTRQNPVAAAELVAVAEPAVCHDLSCGMGDRKASDVAPVIHIIFASFSAFLGKARHQLAASVSAG